MLQAKRGVRDGSATLVPRKSQCVGHIDLQHIGRSTAFAQVGARGSVWRQQARGSNNERGDPTLLSYEKGVERRRCAESRRPYCICSPIDDEAACDCAALAVGCVADT